MMRRICSLAVIAFCFCIPAALLAADWPQFGGPNANFVSTETGINKDWNARTPKMLWQVPLSDDGYAGPSVVNGKVYIIDHNGSQDIVRALDAATGKDVWKFAYDDTARPNYGFARSTPVFDNGKLYVWGRLGQLYCLDAATGKRLWFVDTFAEFSVPKRPTWLFSGSPLIDGEKVIVTPGGPDAAIVALDKNTGKTIWKGGGSDIAGYSTPVIATINGIKQYVNFAGTSISGVNAADGTLLWQLPWKTGPDVNGALPCIKDNQVFITSGYGHGSGLLVVNGAEPEVRWQDKVMQSKWSTPIVLDGYAYGTGDQNALVCQHIATGELKWKQSGFESGGICLVDGVMIVADGRTGEVAMVRPNPAKYEELGRFTPFAARINAAPADDRKKQAQEKQLWTAPIVANGKLFIRNRCALACFDLQ